MILRFLPNDWWEAIGRPFAMAKPGGGVYVEVSAPDLRFAAAVIVGALLVGGGLLSRRRDALESPRPVLALAASMLVAFAAWLGTSGNGRYFIPFLLLIGPLGMGLIHRLRLTPAFRLSLLAILMGTQWWLIMLNPPWNRFDSWGWIPWGGAPAIALEDHEAVREEEVLYVTHSFQSFSMVAPLFPSSSRWMNLALFSGVDPTTPPADYRPVRDLLASAPRIRILYPGTSSAPDGNALTALNEGLRRHGLAIPSPAACRFVHSATLGPAVEAVAGLDRPRAEGGRASGLWLCDLRYSPVLIQDFKREQERPAAARARAVFRSIEMQCPREAPPGQYAVDRYGRGFARRYASSDTMLTYAADTGVQLHHATLLNPRPLPGLGTDSMARLDCRLLHPRAVGPQRAQVL